MRRSDSVYKYAVRVGEPIFFLMKLRIIIRTVILIVGEDIFVMLLIEKFF
jgi:hypothetical protein